MTYQNEQKKLALKRCENILSDILPLPKDRAVAKICYMMGFTERKAREYIRLLYKNDILYLDNKGELAYNEKADTGEKI